ncbi:MAG: hypothetical protein JKY37_19025 [Nannocystaceae bacterium]|nr:hypothetical protein [Nannocystaceae bacterium]
MAAFPALHRFSPVAPVLLFVCFGLGAPGCFSVDSDSDAETEGTEDGADTADATGTADDETEESSGAGDDDAAQACEAYCEIIGDHCEDDQAQYSGGTLCESTCTFMAPGNSDDALGNTVGCRTTHALRAAEQPDTHCSHAGPTGAGTCGGTCESFCSLALEICVGDLEQWPDADACVADCSAWNPEPLYDASVPDADTYACHMRHLTLAAAQADPHCDHLGPDSPVCRDD